MFASRFFVSFLAFSALSAYASPAPVVVEKRAPDVSSVLAIISTLQGSTSTIVPQINALAANKQATAASVTPLAAQLVTAFNTAHTSLNTLGPVNAASGGTPLDVATAFASIISEVALALEGVETVPGLAGILTTLGLGVSINTVLIGLDVVLIGVVTLVDEL
ncbi:hypothetical protein GALMADRAFT_216006 [Galerina marginata CBS 339.88]|uniref:Uncharacterized protein n=1 Tax=Galerina marginata (strain CBS 339.88) TaxID=685588 RepID=A0A067SB54_GALM3|nr:hypothetical protein GALMADRAFT_216006 [Galerina marginata CBS 339.88]